MLLNNFKKVLFGSLFSATVTRSSISQLGTVTIKDADGNNQILRVDGYSLASMLGSLSTIKTTVGSPNSYNCHMRCGTGTTAPTLDDYALGNEITTGLSNSSAVASFTANNTKEYTATFTNETSNPIVINEVGIFCYNYSDVKYLIERTVLSTPITIPAGESKAITIELDV